MTATAEFIKAAKRPGRVPVLSMKVEDISGNEQVYTTKTDWDGSDTLFEIDTSSDVGSALHETYQEAHTDKIYTVATYRGRYLASVPGNYILSRVAMNFEWNTLLADTTVEVRHVVCKGDPNTPANILYTSASFFVTAVGSYSTGGFSSAYYTNIIDHFMGDGIALTSGDGLFVYFEYKATPAASWNRLGVNGVYNDFGGYFYFINPTAQVVTSTIDMGVTPINDATFTVDDIRPSQTNIIYSLRGSTDNFVGSDVDLGVVVDGSTVAPYRYYKITANFTTTYGSPARVQEFIITIGEFFELSSLPGKPTAASRPYIIPRSVKPLTSRIDLMKPASVGQATLALNWSRYTSDMIFNGNLKNKQVFLNIGYEQLTSADYEPYFTGIWQEYGADEKRRVLSIKLEDTLKRFRKLKIPIETTDVNDNPTTSNYVVSGVNVIQAMLDFIDAIGISDRFIDRLAFENIRDNILTGTDWNVTRTIFADNPQDAWELMNELAVIAGCFLIMLANGKLSIVYYSPLLDPVATIDANTVTVSPLDGGQKNLFTRQLVRYDPAVADPGEDAADYNKLSLYLNATAETEWDLAAERRWYEKWDASQAAVTELTIRMDEWFSNPKVSLTMSGLTLRYINLKPGQIVAIDNLMMPADALDWPGLTNGRKFLIMGMTIDPAKHGISLNLLELGESARYDATAYSITNGGDPSSNLLSNVDLIDDLVIECTEIAGQQWVLEFTFEPTIDCHQVIFYGHYNGSPNHDVYLEAWNYTNATWDRFTADNTDFPDSDTDYYKVFNFPHPISDYREVSSAGNESKVRLRHINNGSNGHFMHVDMINLRSQG